MEAPQSALSQRLSREYPEASRTLNRAIRDGNPVKIILENGSSIIVRSSARALREERVVINLQERQDQEAQTQPVTA